ncbi:hypothetical protein BDFB_010845 [Asbolus verrucosus]|uniref:Uncharacterized protein n=1 Tax=Asbolus verrucosus TaxID=1661398 RepID=A0A482W555_ASBVE|nr:hypothetical protein BDFB_010845 [Asbolus verrucosus]
MEIPHEVLAEEGIKTEWVIVPVADKEGLKMARSAANSEGNKGADYRYPLALLTAPLKYVSNYFGNPPFLVMFIQNQSCDTPIPHT